MARNGVLRSPTPSHPNSPRAHSALQLGVLLAATVLGFSVVMSALFVGAIITTSR